MLDKLFKTIDRVIPHKWKWVLSHGGFRRYFANTGWMFFGQMFGLGVSFFVGVWMARYLGPENYGILNYSVAFVGLFAFIASLGINSILDRDLVRYPERRDEYLGTAFRLKLFGGAIAMAVTVVTISIIESSSLIKFLVLLYSFTFILQSINVISTFFQAKVESKRNVKAQVMASLISSALKIAMIVSGLGVIWLVAIYVLDSVLLGLFRVLAYKSSGLKMKKWKYNGKLAKQILSGSWLLMFVSVSTSIYMRIDQVIIKAMIDESAVGIYSVATKLSEIWNFIPVIICGSLFPAVLNARKVDKNLYFKRLKKLFLLILSLALLVSVSVSFLSDHLILFLFGDQYASAVSTLSIYAWSVVGIFFIHAIGRYLISENYLKIYFFASITGAVLNILLNIIFIPKYGINGAAASTVASYLAVPLFLLFFNKTRKDMFLIFNTSKNENK